MLATQSVNLLSQIWEENPALVVHPFKIYNVKNAVLYAVEYFVITTGNVTDKMIKDYIDRHEHKEDKFGDFQVKN